MSIILKSGSSGFLADIDSSNRLSVAVNGSIAAGSNLIGQVEITDGTFVLGTLAHPMIVSSAPAGDRIVTGNITASPQFVTISGQGAGAILFSVTGTWSGTLIFQASVDGTNWLNANVLPKFPGGAVTNNTTANGQWTISAGGLNSFRVGTMVGWTGTAVITLEAGQALNAVEVYQSVASNLLTNINASGTALTATGSALDVNIASGSVAVSGTITANQGTSPWVVSLTSTTITGTVAVTQSTSPWVVSGTVTANQGGAPWSQNLTEVGGAAISLGQTTMSASAPVVIASDQSVISTQDEADGTPGAVAPSVALQIGGSDGTDLRALLTSVTGQLHVIADSSSTTVITGTVAVTQSTSPWVVSLTSTTITGTVAVTQSTSPWIVAGGLTNDDAAPSANNVGVLPALANAAAPTYTEGNQVLLSTNLSGALRVSTAAPSDTTSTGTITSSQNVFVNTQGASTVGINITGTWTGTLDFEATTDGVTFFNLQVYPVSPWTAGTETTTANGEFTAPVGGYQQVRVRGNTVATGTATVSLDSAIGNQTVYIKSLVADDVNVTAQQGGSWTVTAVQGTAASLNATVVGTGTFAVQASQSGNWTSRIVGNTGATLDQAPGSAIPTNAVFVGGSDGTNLRAISMDSTGQVKVLVQNTPSVTVSGSVSVTQGTSPWVVSLTSTTITGTVAVTQSTSPWVVSLTSTTVTNTVAENLTQVAGTTLGSTAVTNFGTAPAAAAVQGVNASIYAGTTGITATGSSINANITNTVPVTLTSTTITGTVAVTQSTSPWVVSLTSTTVTNTVAENLTQVAGTTLGSTAVTNFGTAPAAAAVQGVNASLFAGTTGITATGASLNANITNTVTVSGTVAATQSGNWTTRIVGNTGVVLDAVLGATKPANVLQVGGNDGTNAFAIPLASGGGSVVISGSISFTAPQHVILDSGTLTSITNAVTVSQGTAANLNATVVGTGTFTVQAQQSGNWTTRIVGNAGATLDGTVAAGTAPTNALAVLGQFNTTIPALTAAQTIALQTDVTGAQAINTEGRKQTYRVGVVGFTPIAQGANTSPLVSITGSGTKTIRITRIVFSASAATGTIADLQIRRFSALTGGTPNTQAANVAKMDTNNSAQTAVVNQWSAAATTATSAGIFSSKRYEVVTAAVSVQPGEIEWKFGDDNGQSLVLRGTGDFAGICISAVGTTPVGDCWIEWSEE